MSDQIKIQTSSPDELPGGQAPLTADQEQKSRSGFTGSQVFPLSGRSGVEVAHGSAGLCSPNNADGAAARPIESVNSMFVSAPVAVSIRPVDRKTIEGSTPGDFRAKAAPAVLPNQPAPRSAVGQANLSGKIPAPSAPTNFAGNILDSDAGN